MYLYGYSGTPQAREDFMNARENEREQIRNRSRLQKKIATISAVVTLGLAALAGKLAYDSLKDRDVNKTILFGGASTACGLISAYYLENRRACSYLINELNRALEVHPVIALLGPRQCGKSSSIMPELTGTRSAAAERSR